MSIPDTGRLAELAWRRSLTPEQQARLRDYLATHPAARGPWELEAALTRALHALPPAPVSSNFTALVLQAVQRAPARSAWRRRLELASWLPAGWLPRAALAATMICLSVGTALEAQTLQRQKMARDIASVGALASLQPVDWLQDFQTIEKLNRVEVADDVLLQVLR